jgi:hypothetical protein
MYAAGGSCLYTVCIVLMSEWFVARKGLANAVMMAGTRHYLLCQVIGSPQRTYRHGYGRSHTSPHITLSHGKIRNRQHSTHRVHRHRCLPNMRSALYPRPLTGEPRSWSWCPSSHGSRLEEQPHFLGINVCQHDPELGILCADCRESRVYLIPAAAINRIVVAT